MSTARSRHAGRRHDRSERGAILIHVAIALLVLIALSAFVLDYGVMWASRGQAQTAADAGALAGASALAWDNSNDFDAAKAKARAVALQNLVWGSSPDVQLTDVTFPPCPPGAPGLPDTCVKVDVYRNQARRNALPIFFASLVGIGNQGVRATATAQIQTGSTVDCLRPWAILDRWQEAAPPSGTDQDPGPWGPTSTYDKYSDGKGSNPPYEPDLYVPPSSTSPGTGFTLPADEGRQFAIKVGDNSNMVSSGWFRAIDLPRIDGLQGTGGNGYRNNIEGCNGLPSSYWVPGVSPECPTDIGNDEMAYWAARGCYKVETGNLIGPTQQGIDTLIAKDPTAYWDTGANCVKRTGSSECVVTSARIVPIGVMDIDWYLAQNPTGSNGVLKMVNIFGFFIEGMGDVDKNGNITCCSNGGKNVIGRIMTIPASGSSVLDPSASFLRTVLLVR